MRLLFAITLFVSAALLFLVQPLLARMVLPLLGGAPAVWNTCMVFFQAALLAGYAYAHAAPAWLGVRRHAVLHLGLLLLPLLVLPLCLPGWYPNPDDFHPIIWLIGLLLISAGLPFTVIATSTPLLQRWFTHTAAPAARDPYFLYGASNLGSILGLLAYPFLLEPTLSLAHQSLLWTTGYGLLIALTAACAVCLWRAPAVSRVAPGPASRVASAPGVSRNPTPGAHATRLAPRRLRWVLLAFTPSSLMLSVTAYLSTDVAAIPLLWVAPLTLYLLTFVLTFARRPPLSQNVLTRWMPLVVLPVVLTLLSQGAELPAPLVIAVHLLALFWIGLVCHGELAKDRPPGEHLTEFYFWLSVGGVLGGAFNALLAPLLFPAIWEYPIVLVLACLLRPAPATDQPSPKSSADKPDVPRQLDWALPAALLMGTSALVFSIQALGVEPGPLSIALMFAVPLLICYLFLFRPVRFALGVAALMFAGSIYQGAYGGTELRMRSFYAVHRVTVDPTGRFRQLVHGDTVHGRQSLRPGEKGEPLTYYYRGSPVGQLFKALHYNERERRDPRLKRVGVVGLGAGALCCYAAPDQRWTFYEIDPAVKYIACDSDLFTFYRDCPANEKSVVLGDARLSLQRSDQHFGVLVVDAFSSDAIPVHLLTREAMKVYFDHLDDNGILAFNISSRYLDLKTVVADLARNRIEGPPLVCYFQEDRDLTDLDKKEGKTASQWMILARDAAALNGLAGNGMWKAAPGREGTAWSDDFSNLLGAVKWSNLGEEYLAR
jgi:hypothetical protein